MDGGWHSEQRFRGMSRGTVFCLPECLPRPVWTFRVEPGAAAQWSHPAFDSLWNMSWSSRPILAESLFQALSGYGEMLPHLWTSRQCRGTPHHRAKGSPGTNSKRTKRGRLGGFPSLTLPCPWAKNLLITSNFQPEPRNQTSELTNLKSSVERIAPR